MKKEIIQQCIPKLVMQKCGNSLESCESLVDYEKPMLRSRSEFKTDYKTKRQSRDVSRSVRGRIQQKRPERSLRLCLLRKIRSISAVFTVCYEMRKRCMRIYPDKMLITEKRPTGKKVKPSQKRIIHVIPIPYTA
jgi:hypothetical protein